ncbi:MAG TPA: hypothetical protein VJ799_11940 [Nitrososphaeraceae archaeon]|jgi:hypothetical protein|nr:hypothetical protein [Nitrososphaeraceae archaeon]
MISETKQLDDQQRQRIEISLANYNIPFQILEKVADKCGCKIDARSFVTRGSGEKTNRFSCLNNETILLLRRIFLDCENSFSSYRLAVYMSWNYYPKYYKFLMSKNLEGVSGTKYFVDVCVYTKNTQDLVAVGIENQENGKKTDSKSLKTFLKSVKDICGLEKRIQSIYYASSSGYEESNDLKELIGKYPRINDTMLRFIEFRDKVFCEINPQRKI